MKIILFIIKLPFLVVGLILAALGIFIVFMAAPDELVDSFDSVRKEL